MFSHITVGVTDYGRAAAFYKPIMEALGLPIKFTFGETGAVAWGPADASRPIFLITKPFNQTNASAGNGSMTALESNAPAIRKVLEINPKHDLVKRLMMAGGDTFNDAAHLLLDQARIVEGEAVPDPAAFARRMSSLMAKGLT